MGIRRQGSAVTKHYYTGGQRIAVRVNGTLYFLHSDHLGSTTLLTDQNQQVVARRGYYPYGDTRYAIGETPTDRLFTGQRWDSALGLYDYRARYYDPLLGRFISPDPLVPQPGNPQALNRYAYVYNNPLRYTDPSGYLTEDQIKAYLGADTWEDVLALFEKGGALEGRWGWLETLRWARLGDEILFFGNFGGLWPSDEALVFQGTLVDREGQLYVRSKEVWIPASRAAWLGNAYGVARWYGDEYMEYLGTLYAEQKYYHLKFDPTKVDWVGVGLDLAGIVADTTSYVGGRVANAAQVARAAEKASVLISDISLYRTGIPFALNYAKGEASLPDAIDFALDVLGLYVPFGPDAISLVWEVSKGFYFTP